jgi:hypothetical protein
LAGRKEKSMSEYFIVTTAHKGIWPRGVVLFWAADRGGYSTFLEMAGRYSEADAKDICNSRGHVQEDFMVPCELVEREAVRVVDLDKMGKLIEAARARIEAQL